MKLYTTYFAKTLCLPSYVVPVSVALWPPAGWKGACLRDVAPNADILRRYKQNSDWEEYTRLYNDLLSRLDPAEIVGKLQELAGGRDVALVCFEKFPNPCHRYLLAKWLTAAGYPCKEYVF